mgnify:CR=1 FL=1
MERSDRVVTITKITTQKNNAERFNIFIDQGQGEEYGFSVDQDILIQFKLQKGKTIDLIEMQQVLAEDRIKKGFNLSLKYLSFRMRTELEVIQYLQSKEYVDDEIAKVLSKLKDYNFLNDEEYANAFVRTKKNTGNKGPAIISQQLKKKGVQQALIEQSLGQFSYAEQLQQVITFIEKQHQKNKRESEQAYRQKVTRQLLSKGFTYEVIEEAYHVIKTSQQDEEEWEAISYQGEKAKKKYAHLQGTEYRYKIKQWLYQRGFAIALIDKYLAEEDES